VYSKLVTNRIRWNLAFSLLDAAERENRPKGKKAASMGILCVRACSLAGGLEWTAGVTLKCLPIKIRPGKDHHEFVNFYVFFLIKISPVP